MQGYGHAENIVLCVSILLPKGVCHFEGVHVDPHDSRNGHIQVQGNVLIAGDDYNHYSPCSSHLPTFVPRINRSVDVKTPAGH